MWDTTHCFAVEDSNDNTFYNNSAIGNRNSGFNFIYTHYCSIIDNEAIGNFNGMKFENSPDSTLFHNLFMLNSYKPIVFYDSYNNLFINTPPEMTVLEIIPNFPLRNENITLSYEYFDWDDDQEGDPEVRWYKNNILQPTYNDHLNISGSITEGGDVWNASVRLYDGKNYSIRENYSVEIIDNERPYVSNLMINNNSERIGFYSDLTLNYTYYDFDNDVEGAPIIRWYKNGIPQDQLNDLLIIDNSATDEGDIWNTSIQVYDGTSYGEIKFCDMSNINYLPVINDAYIYPRLEALNYDDLSVHYICNDEDDDDVFLITEGIKWFLDGVLQSEFNGIEILEDQFIDTFQQWHAEFSVSDGYDNVSCVTENITIINEIPVASVTIFPSKPMGDEDLVASYSFYDWDHHGEHGTQIRWYLNNTLQEIYNDMTTVPKNALVDNDVWKVTVRPCDGYDFGDISESDSVTIGGHYDHTFPDDSNKINGYPFQLTGFFLIISIIGIISLKMKKIH